MGISKILEEIQKREEGKIILINCGAFYIAIGKNAILLNKILGLKISCMSKEVCKVGFPIASLEKYTKLIEEKEYGYIVYEYEGKENELTIVWEYEGKKRNNIGKYNMGCKSCSKMPKTLLKDDKYIKLVEELYKKKYNCGLENMKK